MARRATVIQRVRSEAQHPVLVLDAGGTLLGEQLALDSEGRVVVEAMNAMGYDAMTIGQIDMAKGLAALQQRASEAQFPFLSANLVSKESGQPIFEPYVVLEREGLHIGVIGVTEPWALEGLESRAPTAQLGDPAAAVRRYLPEVRAQAEIVVVLSHLGLEDDKSLALAVPGIDVIVGGRSRNLMRAPEQVGQTAIIQIGYDGEWLGRLDLAVDGAGAVASTGFEVLYMRQDVPDDPALAALVDSYRQRYPTPTPLSP